MGRIVGRMRNGAGVRCFPQARSAGGSRGLEHNCRTAARGGHGERPVPSVAELTPPLQPLTATASPNASIDIIPPGGTPRPWTLPNRGTTVAAAAAAAAASATIDAATAAAFSCAWWDCGPTLPAAGRQGDERTVHPSLAGSPCPPQAPAERSAPREVDRAGK